MEAVVVAALVLLMSSSLVASDWCVCRSDQPQAALQKTIDYACGAGADCNSIHEQGQCFNPNTVVAHCSWAANSYFQRNRAMGATCDFTGTATLTTSDPSVSGCSFPASASPKPKLPMMMEQEQEQVRNLMNDDGVTTVTHAGLVIGAGKPSLMEAVMAAQKQGG
ncbi:hypothetical protein OsJ_25011 [Oryza sativa Japonica Group]|uniref:X8 domain-containing protein n=1 Tax=Oryza sativa subsp. japonica TaxID=39947 RepID=A3BLW7_ORYSJ|nr:hypothetical protein OsJ_25011 [Oryza sativa Japonica Group]